MEDLTLRLHTEVLIIEDLGASAPNAADVATSYGISVQLIGTSDEGFTWFDPQIIHTETSRTASDDDIDSVTKRAVIALADLIGERMRKGA